MAYSIPKAQPKPRDAALERGVAAPGLYDGELLVDLDGDMAAVSARAEWLENGAGVTLFGVARVCDAGGQTRASPDGRHLETAVSLTVDPVTLAAHGVDALRKEVLLALMGEEPELLIDDGEGKMVPAVKFDPTVKLNASARQAARVAKDIAAATAPAALLSRSA